MKSGMPALIAPFGHHRFRRVLDPMWTDQHVPSFFRYLSGFLTVWAQPAHQALCDDAEQGRSDQIRLYATGVP